jgi:hypothetical protein
VGPRALSLLALGVACLALALSAMALRVALHKPQVLAAQPTSQEISGRLADTSRPPDPCVEGWHDLPADIQGAWPPAEFELKCKAHEYVAVCENETLDFSDISDLICRSSKVKFYTKFKDG